MSPSSAKPISYQRRQVAPIDNADISQASDGWTGEIFEEFTSVAVKRRSLLGTLQSADWCESYSFRTGSQNSAITGSFRG